MRRFSEAERSLRDAIRTEPDDADNYLDLSTVLGNSGDTEGAAALAVHKLSGNVVAPNDARDSDANAAGYRLTEHVRRYYQTTKI